MGAVHSAQQLVLSVEGGGRIPLQASRLDPWPDGSWRWALIDFLADHVDDVAPRYVLSIGSEGAVTEAGLAISVTDGVICVQTGPATFTFRAGGAFPISQVEVHGNRPVDWERSALCLEVGGRTIEFQVDTVRLRESGPLRAAVDVQASARGRDESSIEVSACVEVFAGSSTTRIDFCVRNTRPAEHPNGVWLLGDRGSVELSSLTLQLQLTQPIREIRCAAEFGSSLTEMASPFEIFQASSGGENWQSPTHRDRTAEVPLQFRGYRLRSGDRIQSGLRATPVVVAENSAGLVAATMPQFWQNFPRSIGARDAAIELGLFPREEGRLHELQGGEQKSFVVCLAFDRDAVSDPPLAWCHDPQSWYPSPQWCCSTGAIPQLTPASEDPNHAYLSLVSAALDSVSGFHAKRELADEFGWRHFGDLPADHEWAFLPQGQWLVSHYNNQYDALECFALQFLRTGDYRWRELMVDLARHTRDIDIYHTAGDKAAYNGGLFWHTAHYVDAGTSTHRTYPRGSAGGGPSSEHNYNAGLMLHYFLTGDSASRDAAIGLGQWVLDMEDGSRTPFRWLAAGATGLATASGSRDYHGPGRAGANSIKACLVAHRLTGNPAFSDKADELIRRCIHPLDDVAARNLFDVERRWYYTMFLQTIGLYLEQKATSGQRDEMYDYARQSLVRYARWMAGHERPYLDHPELLEFPNETWTAQDLRKAEVLHWAARHVDEDERLFFVERARQFFDHSVGSLSATPKHGLTRPLVLVLSNGFRNAWFKLGEPRLASASGATLARETAPQVFTSQKTRALKRAKAIAVAVAAATAVILAFFLG